MESSWLYGYLFDPEEAATIVGAVAMDSNRAICCWAIQTPAGHAWSWTTTDERTDPIEDPERHHETPLAALNDLDPNDSRTLPDGSLWVLAEAMRRIGLHVAGRT